MLFENDPFSDARSNRRTADTGRAPVNSPDAIPADLDLRCNHHSHANTIPMRFIGAATSPKGQWYAVYACPQCNTRTGWVYHRFKGKPFQLWIKPAFTRFNQSGASHHGERRPQANQSRVRGSVFDPSM